jgi:hypothetical protein
LVDASRIARYIALLSTMRLLRSGALVSFHVTDTQFSLQTLCLGNS